MRKALLLALGLAAGLRADSPGVGTTSATFLKLGSSARSEAMGEAYVGLADDAGGIAYNPSGMLMLDQSVVQLTHTSWFGGVNFEQLNYISAINSGEAAGFSFAYVQLPGQPVTVATGNSDPLQSFKDIGSINPYDMRGSVAYARTLWGIKTGAMINITGQNVESHTAVGLGLDVGALMDLFIDDLEGGISIQNIGPSVPLVGEAFALPMTMRGGFSYRLRDAVIFSLEAGLPNDNSFFGAAGMEAILNDSLFLRLGYRYDGIFNPFTAGLGFKLDSGTLDLAWVPMGELGSTYRISLGYNWGGWVSPDKDADLEVINGVFMGSGGKGGPDFELQPLVREPHKVKDWSVYVYGGTPATVVKRFKGLGPFGSSLDWDAKSDSGQQLPDGTYQAILSVRLKSGKIVNSFYKKLLLNPPLPEASLFIDSNSLVLGHPDTVFVPSDFDINVVGNTTNLPVHWRAEMQDSSGRVFQTVEGPLTEHSVFRWTGTNDKGEQFISNTAYQFTLSFVDAKGQVLKSFPPMTKRCVFRY